MNTTPNMLPVKVRRSMLTQVCRATKQHFAHWEDAAISPEQLDEAFITLKREALTCANREQFSLLLMAFLARLNNGHTRWRDPAFEAHPPLGMRLRLIEGRWMVIASGIAELRAGDVILNIAGKPIETWYSDLQRYLTGSPQSRTVQFGDQNRIFPPVLGLCLPDSYTLTFEDVRGLDRTLSVDRTALGQDNVPASIQGRWLVPDLVAYIKIPSFFYPEFEERALAYVETFARAAHLIVDIRGNGGGNTPNALIHALLGRPYRRWPDTCPAPSGYTGQVSLLIDRATWSAAEDLAMPFKDNRRAILIGEPSGGSTGQPYFHTFENGLQFSIGAQRVRMPDGATFEGVGLVPDIVVNVQRADLYAGRDPVLEKAVAITRSTAIREFERGMNAL